MAVEINVKSVDEDGLSEDEDETNTDNPDAEKGTSEPINEGRISDANTFDNLFCSV